MLKEGSIIDRVFTLFKGGDKGSLDLRKKSEIRVKVNN